MGAVDDVPSLVVRYNARGVSSSDLQTLEQLVARPFCEAVVAAGSEAFVYLVEDEKRARGWSCASQADTGWHDISPEPPKPRSTPRPNRGTAAADSREQFAALPYRYRRLPVASNRP
jgi:hypothetical protein